MFFDDDRPAGQLQDLRVGQHESMTFFRGGLGVAGCVPGATGVDHLLFFGAQLLVQDGPQVFLVEQRLEDQIVVWRDRPLHDVFAQTPGGVDDDDVRKAGLGVDGKHHAGAGTVRAHHLLHANGQGDLQVVEVLGLPVNDGPVRKEGGIAATAGIEELLSAGNIEKGLLLAGKAGVGQIFGGGAAANGHIDLILSKSATQLSVSVPDGIGDLLGPAAPADEGADGFPSLVQTALALAVGLEVLPDFFLQVVSRQKLSVGGGGGGKAVRDSDPLRLEGGDHLPQRSVLSSDEGNIPVAQIFKPADGFLLRCHGGLLPASCRGLFPCLALEPGLSTAGPKAVALGNFLKPSCGPASHLKYLPI